MSSTMVLFMALLPAVVLFGFIYLKDRRKPEPAGQLGKAFLFGVLSTLPVFVYGFIVPTLPESFGVLNALYDAFVCAAIPEEISKLFFLWLVLRRNRHFDEKFDGIVYGACVALGFAAFENVLYLFNNLDQVVSVAIIRAVLSVPMHFLCGVIMGYYFSLAKFYPYLRKRNMALALIVPIAIHGLFDMILMLGNYIAFIDILLFVAVGILSYYAWKRALHNINEHLVRDSYDCSVDGDGAL